MFKQQLFEQMKQSGVLDSLKSNLRARLYERLDLKNEKKNSPAFQLFLLRKIEGSIIGAKVTAKLRRDGMDLYDRGEFHKIMPGPQWNLVKATGRLPPAGSAGFDDSNDDKLAILDMDEAISHSHDAAENRKNRREKLDKKRIARRSNIQSHPE